VAASVQDDGPDDPQALRHGPADELARRAPGEGEGQATPTRSIPAPFPSKRKGRYVMKAVREPLSIPWIADRMVKPRESGSPSRSPHHPVRRRSALGR